MSGNSPKPPPPSSNHWLSSILRPRASSVSVESCLNINNADPATSLDARPVLPLLSNAQPLAARCKHLKILSELCESYKFMNLENVFFTVQDILQPTMSRDARHMVFDFMLSCINGQYSELGMARVTFYNSLLCHDNWEDVDDMYRVLFALCKGGRDISGFEKNINKLLIKWLDMTLKRATQPQQTPHQPTTLPSTPSYPLSGLSSSIPPAESRDRTKTTSASAPPTPISYLSDILHLLMVIAKFNFALFEEPEVTDMIAAVRRAFFHANHPDDFNSCLAFADVVVRYRFVPFEALRPFLEMLCATVMRNKPAPSANVSCWSIFLNLLRSHCAHSAILTLCKFMEENVEAGSQSETLVEGAVTLLSETAWGLNSRTGAEMYMVPDSVLLMYLRRGAHQKNSTISTSILKNLTLLVQISENQIGLMDWDTIWDICDICTDHILGLLDESTKLTLVKVEQKSTDNKSKSHSVIYQFQRFLAAIYDAYISKKYYGPVGRFMNVLYTLRNIASEESASVLLDYYEKEHLFLPSAENWIELVLEMANTFFIRPGVPDTIRLRVLSIVTDVCISVKDFYSEVMYERVVSPMMETIPKENNIEVRQKAFDLIVDSLSDCQNEEIFNSLLLILRNCCRCGCYTRVGGTDSSLFVKQEKTVPEQHVPSTESQHPSTHIARVQSSHRQSSPKTTAPIQIQSSISISLDDNHGGKCIGIPAVCGLVELFEQLLPGDNGKYCSKVFQALAEVANDNKAECPYDGPMLAALDILLRLRCLPNHHLYVTPDNLQSDYGLLRMIRQMQQKRTEEKKKKKLSNQFSARPLADEPTKTINHRLSLSAVSYKDDQHQSDAYTALDMDEALRSFIGVISYSSNWNLVLFVLKRLPAQLSNKHMFCGSPTQVQKLRRRIVKWISTRKFLESVSSIPRSVKRNDLNVFAYDLLTVLISFRRIFNKQDQDEMVYAFYIGITQVTAATKPCINALTVCCHELPLSVAKMLNEILQRMSQIISVSSVSVHILEFLSGLARLPSLYANFTGDMYKPVFAIALNYLQHSRSTSQPQQPQSPTSTPGSSNSPMPGSPVPPGSASSNTAQPQKDSGQGALSQYVLTMAYLVITVWFTAIPLRERRRHVPFIIQRLLGGNPVGRSIDEQTYTCIDMLSRFTFANLSLSPEKSMVSKILMGGADPKSSNVSTTKQNSRTWRYGHTLLTLKTAKALGWVEITIRRPSGTVSMMCNIENKVKSDDIDYKTLPALLMMQYQPDLVAQRILKETQDRDGLPSTDGDALGITFENAASGKGPTPQDPSAPESNTTTPPKPDTESTGGPASTMIPTQQQNHAPAASSVEPLSKAAADTPSTASVTDAATEIPGKLASADYAEPDKEDKINTTVREALSDPAGFTQPTSHIRKTEQTLDPGFLYLQLHNYPDLARVIEVMPPLPDEESTTRTIGILDRIPVVDFHKIGVLYVGKGQRDEVDILANTHGSPDYVKFLNALGALQRLRGRTDNTGGLDRENDIDGKYAYFWKDDVTEMVFHAATMMPTNLERDPRCGYKKRHIGNDFVTIVYNDSELDYAFDTLPGQFNFINIVVSPHSISTEQMTSAQTLWGAENSFFKVEMQRKPNMPELGPITEPKLISAQSLPGFVRQAALHANIFSQVYHEAGQNRAYVSHWTERLRHILRIKPKTDRSQEKERVAGGRQELPLAENSKAAMEDGYPVEALLDFTRYTY